MDLRPHMIPDHIRQEARRIAAADGNIVVAVKLSPVIGKGYRFWSEDYADTANPSLYVAAYTANPGETETD